MLIAYEESDYGRVIELTQKANKLDTGNYDLLYAIGDSYLKLDSFANAKKYFKYGLKMHQEDKMLLFKMGVCDYSLGNESFSWFGLAILQDHNFEQAWYYKGLSAVKSGHYQNALNSFKKTLELNPYNHRCYQQLSLCSYLLDNPHEAIKTINQAIEMKDSSYYFYQKAVITDYLGLYDKSLALCDSSIVRDSLHIESYALKAQNLINLDKFEDGCIWAEKVKEMAPEKDMSRYDQFCN